MIEGLIIDNFAGGGGASIGIEEGFGRPVDVAINHSQAAIAMHKANHPHTEHYCQSVWRADPLEVTKGQPVALAWFSPDCKHFSKAKGGRPVEKGIRDLAWVVVHWARRVRPAVIMLENVEEFRQWCPVDENGQPIDTVDMEHQPDMLAPTPEERKLKRKTKANGETFELWCAALRKEGYVLEWKELRGCDYGAPTIRKRLFVIARCDGQPIVWPEPTHGPAESEEVKRGDLLPYRTAAEIIDWSIPCPSIFERKRPLVENTLKRIAAGLKRFVIDSDSPFVVPAALIHTAHGESCSKGKKRGRGALSVHEPLPTTTSKGNIALASATLIHRGNGEREGQAPRAMDPKKPLGTVVASGVKHGVAEVTLEPARQVAAFMAQHQGASRGRVREGREIDEPLGTIVHRGTQQNIVVAHLEQANTGLVGHPVTKPVSTIITKGCTQRLVTSHLTQLRGTCKDGRPVDQPLATVTAGGLHIAEVRSLLEKHGDMKIDGDVVTVTIGGEEWAMVDIGMRMLTPRELASAQGFPEDYILDPIWKREDARGREIVGPIPATHQVSMIGNSVNKDVAAALVRTNCQTPAAAKVAL